MKALRNILALSGLLLMTASFVWMQLRQTERTRPASAPKTAQPAATSSSLGVVILDPGHGGQDSGAMCGGVLEKDLTLDVARRVDRLLDSQGVATLMTRLGDTYVSLADRAALANRIKNCIFVSIHFNEDNKPVASGVETYYAPHQISAGSSVASWLPFLWKPLSDVPNPESQRLAGFVQEALVARTRAIDRGTQPGQFFVIANVSSPAVLIEGGFLTNKEDISKLTSQDYRDQIAAALADGILRYRDAASGHKATLAVTNPKNAE
ncbi:MAG TPA: N-acetylmuramoyl-L-alanine amidase [Candidatus Udaeobacter sp.]|jgi:N-acetylmuramoyl-L-alanine amidase|nr:N-acetylmuramoyl-L-alanine amidase [Candidatus Udaeobacter sp.]